MKTRHKIEYGDFQTPDELARQVCQVLAARGLRPASIVEPTCGRGSFLLAAMSHFPEAKTVLGLEVNGNVLEEARARVSLRAPRPHMDLREGDFFHFEWPRVLNTLPEPVLVVGNPPWVTNAELGGLGSANLPAKSNFQNRRGLDALTGKSNFDIAEWMVIHLLDWLNGRQATVAMLLKTAVARRVLLHAWKSGFSLAGAALLTFDARKYFGVGVEACLLIVELCPEHTAQDCQISDLVHPGRTVRVITYDNGTLIANKAAFNRWHHLTQGAANKTAYRWRSGLKHDCAPVMELGRDGSLLRNGLSEVVDIEDECIYPLLKGSDVAKGNVSHPKHAVIVTQKETGQDTAYLALTVPRTWQYLCDHAAPLDSRRSSIYRRRPRFSVFGIGGYSFAPWKVAISALHKKLQFSAVGSYQGKPIILDDTCYHLSCVRSEEAELLATLLNSETAKAFFDAFIFWDSKRPITVDVLGRLDILALADELGEKGRLLDLRPDLASKTALERSLF
jgi:hypothetical protein